MKKKTGLLISSNNQSSATDFNTYNEMLQFIYYSMKANNGEGRKHLEAALKLQK